MNLMLLIIPTGSFLCLYSRDLKRKSARKIGADSPNTRLKTAERAFRSLSVPHRLPELSAG